MSQFEIRRPYRGDHISRKIANAAARGIAYGSHASDPASADLAGGTNFLGFVTRDVVAGGPVLADHVFPGRLELPFTAGDECSLCKADEIEVEGDLNNGGMLTTSGTGAITGGSSVGAALSFNNGKLRAAQGGDQVFYRLSAQLTPETVGNVRIRAEIIR